MNHIFGGQQRILQVDLPRVYGIRQLKIQTSQPWIGRTRTPVFYAFARRSSRREATKERRSRRSTVDDVGFAGGPAASKASLGDLRNAVAAAWGVWRTEGTEGSDRVGQPSVASVMPLFSVAMASNLIAMASSQNPQDLTCINSGTSFYMGFIFHYVLLANLS